MILVVNVREILQRWAGAKMLHRIPRNKFDIGFGYRVFTSEKGPRPDAIQGRRPPENTRTEGISIWRYAAIAYHKGRWQVGTRPCDDVCVDPVTIPSPSKGSSWVRKLL